MAGPGVELFPLAFVLEKRNAVSARICNACKFDDNDRAGVLAIGEGFCERRKLRLVRLNHTAVAIQAKNVRRPLERAEHENDSSVLFEVSDGLHTAAGE